MHRLHDDELSIDLALVRALVADAFPEYGDHALVALAESGSSNRLFRLGEEMLVRLPRRPGGSAGLLSEARWLPGLAARLDVAVPAVVAIGEPGRGYPERWSLVRWLPGRTPPVLAPAERRTDLELARSLARVIDGLRTAPVPGPALGDPALRGYRGGSLAQHDRSFRASLAACRRLRDIDLDLEAVAVAWEAARRLPGWDRPTGDRWLHGDLLAENLLVDQRGRLTGVLDFGGLAVGDPTVDLVCAWELLDPAGRAELRATLDVDDAEWGRGRAWALAIAVMTLPYYRHTMPRRCADRRAMARAALAEA